MLTEHAPSEANITVPIQEIVVEHYPYRSCRKDKIKLPFWMGNERHAGLVVFLKITDDKFVFLRRIERLDGAKVEWKKAMIQKVYGELLNLVLTFKPGTLRGHPLYTVNSVLPDWMEEASYRELKKRHQAIKKEV